MVVSGGNDKMEKDLIWCAALLTSYRYLPRVARGIDRCSYATAMGGLSSGEDAIKLFDRILALNVRKEAIVNAKVLTDMCLSRLESKSRQLLESRYIGRKSFDEIAEQLGVGVRTVFRRHTAALSAMASAMRRLGYGHEWLDSRLGADTFMREVYEEASRSMRQSGENGEREARESKRARTAKACKSAKKCDTSAPCKAKNRSKQSHCRVEIGRNGGVGAAACSFG